MTDICRLCASVEEKHRLFNILDPEYQITNKVLKSCQINLQEFEYLPQFCCSMCLSALDRFIAFIEKCSATQETLKISYNITFDHNFFKIKVDQDPKDMTQKVVETTLVQEETAMGDSQICKYLKLPERNCKSRYKVISVVNSNPNLPPQNSGKSIISEEWLICEAPMSIETSAENPIESDPEMKEDSFNTDEADCIPDTINTTVEITVESSTPPHGTPDETDKNVDGTINKDGLVKLNCNSWKEYPWSCIECQMQYTSVTDLREHFKTHKQTLKYHCTDCNKICIKYQTFLNHVRRRHRPHLKLCCDICSKFFWHGKLYRKHRTMHGDDDLTHICTFCQKTFRSNRALHSHVKTHLSAEERDSNRCEICDKTFDLRASLLIHKRIHTGIKDFTCDQCGKSFIQKGNLESHLLTHTPLQPFSCNTCNKTFKTQIRLNNHMTVHSGLKPHKCDICGRHFREKSTLREHLRIHTGAMPFACEFCDKRFRFKGILTTHRRQHTGERPYSCIECNHHFTNWPNFNKHMKRRHGINTSVLTRRPQTIPPSGMPPQSKLNFVVPTVDNKIEPDVEENLEEEDESIQSSYYVEDVDEAISDMQQIIEEHDLQAECNETPSLISYISTEPPALTFYNMQNDVNLNVNENSATSY